jgi:peptide/nickel transport system permease protein
MLKFIGRRLASAVLLMLLVTSVVYVLVSSNGMGIARMLVGTSATLQQVVDRYYQLGLDKPVLGQYLTWLGKAVRGDLGTSYLNGEYVTNMLSTRAPLTITIVAVTMVLTMIISVWLGVTAAVKGGPLDRFLQVLSVVGGAIPQFIVAIVLVFTFAVGLRVLPATGIVAPTEDAGLWARSLILPVTAILVGTAMSGAMQIRGSMLVELRKEYVATLRTRGISEYSVLYKHALRNAAGPGLIGLGLLTVAMLGGTVIIERVFALPGMGMLVSSTTTTGDIPALMGCVTVTVVIVSLVNLIIDLLMGILNPKVRL